MDTRAAVAWAAGEPLSLETVQVSGPRAGEVLGEIMATGICHTDAYTLSGADSKDYFRLSWVTKAQGWFERWVPV